MNDTEEMMKKAQRLCDTAQRFNDHLDWVPVVDAAGHPADWGGYAAAAFDLGAIREDGKPLALPSTVAILEDGGKYAATAYVWNREDNQETRIDFSTMGHDTARDAFEALVKTVKGISTEGLTHGLTANGGPFGLGRLAPKNLRRAGVTPDNSYGT